MAKEPAQLLSLVAQVQVSSGFDAGLRQRMCHRCHACRRLRPYAEDLSPIPCAPQGVLEDGRPDPTRTEMVEEDVMAVRLLLGGPSSGQLLRLGHLLQAGAMSGVR